ncbi:hypothetical protein FRC0431_02071 [Corynebacterium diphtheriae]|nr:hypothetical protein FRC0431_02071 [Corynebacterium diphtheriae]
MDLKIRPSTSLKGDDQVIQRKLSQKIHPKQSSKATFSLLAALSVGITTAVLPVAAHAQDAPKPRTASAYQDNYGRNVIGEEKLEQLKPTVTGGEAVIGEDGKALYEYTVKSGFPDDPNNVTAQRWMRLTFTEDPKVPFNKDEKGLPSIDGLPDGAKIEKVEGDEHSWRVVLGAEYLDMDKSGARVNNDKHTQWNAKDGWKKDEAWNPPQEMTLKIPAKAISESKEGTFATGTLKVVSGRLVDIDLKDEINYKFIENDKKGQCTWQAQYKTRLVKEDASYWLQNVVVFSDPESTRDYEALPQRYIGNKPTLIEGQVSVNNEKYKDLVPVTPEKTNDFPGYKIGELVVTDKVPPFYSEKWIVPTVPIEVNYKFKNPCGENVDEQIVAKRPQYVLGYVNGLVPEYTFVQASGTYVSMIRPPEDASGSAEFKFVKEKKPSVSVGDFVWEDTNGDGIQDAGEPGIAGVELKLEAADGKSVTDINGKVVENVTTGVDGKYEFKDLPVLNGGETYKVTVVESPEGYEPTKSGQGSGALARFKDSSDGFAETIPGTLSEAGNKDLTLDFGFVKTSDDTNGNWWWLSLIPLAVLPLIPIFGNHGGSSQPIPPATPKQPAPNKENSQPKQEQPQQPAAKKPQNKQLATTGASVLGLLAIAVALVAGGALLIRSRKNS